MTTYHPKPYAWAEAVFDAAYLLFALFTSCYLLAHAQGRGSVALYGLLALVLGGGDTFHLVPRIYGQLTGRMAQLVKPLGFGKAVTSITMTAFYLLLYRIWLLQFHVSPAPLLRVAVLALAALRVILSLCPQNRWLDAHPPMGWAVGRNVPFALLGLIVLVLYATTAGVAGNPFRWMPVAIALSFGFYIPVVLLAQKYPATGALMLPKTAAYVWMLTMGYALL